MAEALKGSLGLGQPEEAALRRSRPWAPGGHGDRAASGPGPAVRITARRFFFANYEVPFLFKAWILIFQSDSGSHLPIS